MQQASVQIDVIANLSSSNDLPLSFVRPIHDCSHLDGTAVNDFVGHFEKQRFQTIDDAAKLVSKDYYMSKVELKSPYRSVSINARSNRFPMDFS
jgi:hypothetical protein